MNHSLGFLRGGGESAALLLRTDWSKTSLGPPETWPELLKNTLGILFHTCQPMFLWWGEELIQFYNDAYVPSFGVGKHPAAMGQRGEECWSEIWDRIGPQIRAVMENAAPCWFENVRIPIQRNGGLEEVFWTYGYSPVMSADGHVHGTLVSCIETTATTNERRAIAAARAQADAAKLRLQRLLENAPAFVCSLSGPTHVFDFVNPPYARLVGRPVVGGAVIDVVPEVTAQGFVAVLDRVYQTGMPFIGHELPIQLAAEGTERLREHFLNFVYQPRCNAQGIIEGIDVFGFDVTPQVEARREMQKLAETSRAMAEAIPQQVWTAMPDGGLDFVNARVPEYAGLLAEELRGNAWVSIVHPDDVTETAERWSQCLETGTPYEMEFRLRRADGAYRWHLVRAVPLRDPQGAIVKWFGTNTDIDEQKQMRVALARQTELEQYLIGIVSHDLRGPVQAITLATGIIAMDPGLSAQGARALARIRSSAARSARMIRDLLDFTNVRLGGGIPVELRDANVHALAATAVEEMHAAYPGRELVLHPKGEGDGQWDPDRIAQVLSNLLHNAMQHGSPAHPVHVRTTGVQDRVEIEIANQGEPIPPAVLPVLFEPLKRGGVETSDRTTGSIGLGLYIVKDIITRHGGTIEVTSSREAGTSFVVSLPKRAA